MARKRRPTVTDFKLVPISTRLARRRFFIRLIQLCCILLAGIGIGYYLGSPLTQSKTQPNIAELQLQLESAEQQLAIYQADKKISHQATNKVREQYRTLQEQVAELNKAVNFYKSVMDPADRERGLNIEHLSLVATGKHHFDYKLVLTQIGNNKWRPNLHGSVQWQIKGSQDGHNATLAGSVFIDNNSTNRFSFRYFQELSGSLTLPVGFTPQEIIITAISTGEVAYQAKQSLQWTQVEQTRGNT